MKVLFAYFQRMPTARIIVGILVTVLVGVLAAIVVFLLVTKSQDVVPNVVTIEQYQEGADLTTVAAPLLVDTSSNQAVDTTLLRSVPGWFVVILILSLLLTAASLVITFYLYRWRNDIIKTGAMVPDKWSGFLTDVADGSKRVAHEQIKVLDGHARLSSQIQNNVADISQGISEVQQTMLAFQGALDIRDSEIARLKKGYDTVILGKYFSQLVDIMLKASKLSKKESVGQKEMRNISLLILDLLELGGVEEIVPGTDVDFAELGDIVVPHKTSVETDDQKMHGKIAEVLDNGFKLVSGEHVKVLKPATVVIYIYKRGPQV